MLGPFQRGLTLVEGLPGDGFANGNLKGLSNVLIHFVNEEEHGQVEGEESVREICQTVEELRILAAEMDGYHVALVFHTLRDKRFRPGNVLDDLVAAS